VKYEDVYAHLSSFTVKQGNNHRIIHPEYSKLDGIRFRYCSEETKMAGEIFEEFKAILDSFDSDSPIKTLEGLWWQDKDFAELEIGRITYNHRPSRDFEYHLTHNMSYKKYVELGKPATLKIKRICSDSVEAIFDRQE